MFAVATITGANECNGYRYLCDPDISGTITVSRGIVGASKRVNARAHARGRPTKYARERVIILGLMGEGALERSYIHIHIYMYVCIYECMYYIMYMYMYVKCCVEARQKKWTHERTLQIQQLIVDRGFVRSWEQLVLETFIFDNAEKIWVDSL